MNDEHSRPSPSTAPRRDQEEEADAPESASAVWAKAGFLVLLLIGSIALTSMTSMCSNRGIGKLIRRIEHRYGSDD